MEMPNQEIITTPEIGQWWVHQQRSHLTEKIQGHLKKNLEQLYVDRVVTTDIAMYCQSQVTLGIMNSTDVKQGVNNTHDRPNRSQTVENANKSVNKRNRRKSRCDEAKYDNNPPTSPPLGSRPLIIQDPRGSHSSRVRSSIDACWREVRWARMKPATNNTASSIARRCWPIKKLTTITKESQQQHPSKWLL